MNISKHPQTVYKQPLNTTFKKEYNFVQIEENVHESRCGKTIKGKSKEQNV